MYFEFVSVCYASPSSLSSIRANPLLPAAGNGRTSGSSFSLASVSERLLMLARAVRMELLWCGLQEIGFVG